VPPGVTTAEYAEILGGHGLHPGPGYASLAWSDDPAERDQQIDAAAQIARSNVELGNPLVFLAMGMDRAAPRVARAALGYLGSPERLQATLDYVTRAAERIAEAGGVAALHQHVGTWIETEAELRAVLDRTNPGVLGFGPDIGHISWAGADPAALIADYADRLAGVHVKDLHREVAALGRSGEWDYRRTVLAGLWTEPGYGDVNIPGIMAALPSGFDGWFVLEVDRGSTPTPEESIDRCAAWLRQVTA
jgi:inosose dehydratase